jgi:hypothetical protein
MRTLLASSWRFWSRHSSRGADLRLHRCTEQNSGSPVVVDCDRVRSFSHAPIGSIRLMPNFFNWLNSAGRNELWWIKFVKIDSAWPRDKA